MEVTIDFLAQAIKNKPTDGSDCKTLAEAQKELGRLRRVTGKVVKVFRNSKGVHPQSGAAVPPAPQYPKQDEGKKKTSRIVAHNDVAPILQDIEKKHGEEKRPRPRSKRNALTIDHSFKVYKKTTVEKSSEDRALIKSSIKKSSLFNDFSDADLEGFIDVFTPKSFEEGTAVVRQGETGDSFYVVHSGALDIFVNMGDGRKKTETQVGVPYRRGGAFGELALLYDVPQASTIRASEDSALWEITRMAFRGLRLQIEQKAHKMKLKQLESVKIGKHMMSEIMDLSQLESMAMAAQYQKFEAGAIIVKEGEIGNTFYIITKGEVDVYKKSHGNNKIASLGVSSFFGEKALLSYDTRQATCIAATNVNCLALARDDFVLMLGNMEDLLSGQRIHTRKESIVMTQTSFLKDQTYIKLSLNDLNIKGVLGNGEFGKVNLVKCKLSGKLYALKVQSKAHIVERECEDKLVMEFQAMSFLNHPFIVECFQAFQDKKYIYFLMGLLPGGEVLDLLHEYENFPESWVRFYSATIVLVFEYIHEQKIAYRDLKPENLVLDEYGYCRVVDLGLAKRCNNGKTWTLCGTPDYLAPEVFRGKGHDWGVDYWALGVLIYELCYGLPPFYDENRIKTAKKVIKRQFWIPPHFTHQLVDIVSRFLTDQSKRLGRTRNGVSGIKKHAWFAGFDWQALLDHEMKAPWVPDLGNLELLASKEDENWDAPESEWQPNLDMESNRASWMMGNSVTNAMAVKKDGNVLSAKKAASKLKKLAKMF